MNRWHTEAVVTATSQPRQHTPHLEQVAAHRTRGAREAACLPLHTSIRMAATRPRPAAHPSLAWRSHDTEGHDV